MKYALQRLGLLFLRLTMLDAILVPVMIFCLFTWEHYMTPKMLSFRVLVGGMLCLWFVFRKELGFMNSPFKLPCMAYLFFCLLSTFRSSNMFESFGSEYLPHVVCLSFFAILVPKMIAGNRRIIWMVIGLVTMIGFFTGLYGIHQGLGYVDFFIGQRLVSADQGPVSFMGNTNFSANYLILAIPLVALMVTSLRGGAGLNFLYIPLLVVAITYGYHKEMWALQATIVGSIAVFALCFLTENIPLALLLSISTITMGVYLGFTQARFAIGGTFIGIAVMLTIGAYFRFLPWLALQQSQSKKVLWKLTFLSILSVIICLAVAGIASVSYDMLKAAAGKGPAPSFALPAALICCAFVALAGAVWYYGLGCPSKENESDKRGAKSPVLLTESALLTLRVIRKRFRICVATVLIAGFLLTVAAFPLILPKAASIPSFVFRLECWRSCSRTIAENFFLGIGPGQFKIVHPIYTGNLENTVLGVEVLARKVHCDYLAVWVEYGLGAFISFAWFLVLIWLMLHRIFQRLDVLVEDIEAFNSPVTRFYFYVPLGLVGSMLATCFQAGGESNFLQPASTITFWFFAGLIASVYLKLRRGGGSYLDAFESQNAD